RYDITTRNIYSFPTRRSSDLQLSELEAKISELFAGNLINNLSSYPYLSQSWQQAKLTNLIRQLEEIISELKKETYLDAVCGDLEDRKSTRLNSSHVAISYAVF